MNGFGLILISILIEIISLYFILKVKKDNNIQIKEIKNIVIMLCLSIFFQIIFIVGKLYIFLIYKKII